MMEALAEDELEWVRERFADGESLHDIHASLVADHPGLALVTVAKAVGKAEKNGRILSFSRKPWDPARHGKGVS
jgi:hypothetical protein